jgi:hypothetical protein
MRRLFFIALCVCGVAFASTLNITNSLFVQTLTIGESGVGAGASEVTFNETPENVGAGLGYLVFEPGSTNAEVRRISSITGATATLAASLTLASSRLEWVASTKTLQLRRAISSISGDGTTTTVTTSSAHGLSTSDTVYINGTVNWGDANLYNDAVTVTVTSTTEFTFSSPVSASESTGYVVKSTDSTYLARIFPTQTFVVTGSSSNNNTFTVSSVSDDGDAIVVNEAVTDELSGSTTTLGINLNKAHAAGSTVVWVTGGPIHVSWFGAKNSGSTADRTTNRLAIQRALDDGYYQGINHVVLQGPTRYYVDGELYHDREMLIEGWGTAAAQITASNMTFPDDETAVLRSRRDGMKSLQTPGSFHIRANLRNINVEGGNIAGSNGLNYRVQQPQQWWKVRVNDCKGWGVQIGGQQAETYGLMVINCGTTGDADTGGLRLNNAQFIYNRNFNAEQIATGATCVRIEASIRSRNISFENVHIESSGYYPQAAFHATEVFGLYVNNLWHTTGADITTFKFDGVTESSYTIGYCEAGGGQSSSTCYFLDDQVRGGQWSTVRWDDVGTSFSMRSMMSGLVIAGNPYNATDTSSPQGQHQLNLIGNDGRELRLGTPQEGSGNAPAIYARAAAASGKHAAFQDSSGNEDIALDYSGELMAQQLRVKASGPLILSGSGSPESAVTAPIGSMYLRTDGSTGTSIYIKESGTGNTGWVAK